MGPKECQYSGQRPPCEMEPVAALVGVRTGKGAPVGDIDEDYCGSDVVHVLTIGKRQSMLYNVLLHND